jgi:hypothetical protein
MAGSAVQPPGCCLACDCERVRVTGGTIAAAEAGNFGARDSRASTVPRLPESEAGGAGRSRPPRRHLRNWRRHRPPSAVSDRSGDPAFPRKGERVLAGFQQTPNALVDESQHPAIDVRSLPLRRSSGRARRTSRAAAIGVKRQRVDESRQGMRNQLRDRRALQLDGCGARSACHAPGDPATKPTCSGLIDRYGSLLAPSKAAAMSLIRIIRCS